MLDLDIHYGNGLSAILKEKPGVDVYDIWSKTLSSWGDITRANNLKSTFVDNTIDYFKKLNEYLANIIQNKPDLLIYHPGADVWEIDRMGGIKGFTAQLFHDREHLVIKSLRDAGINVVLVLGGGYINHQQDVATAANQWAQLIGMHGLNFDLLR